jgi:hypothetical protein
MLFALTLGAVDVHAKDALESLVELYPNASSKGTDRVNVYEGV